MTPSLWVGQNCVYWTKAGDKPHAALCVAMDESTGLATLAVFTEDGGRFVKKEMPWRNAIGVEGWNELGQVPH
jgi:hypothetical protein